MAPASVSVEVGTVLAGMLVLAAFILSRYETRGGQGRAVRRSDLAQSVRGGATGARLLGLYRVLAFLYTLGVHVHSLVYEMPPYQAYRFYTVWSYTALILYFGVAACHSLSAPSPRSSEKPQPLRSPNEIRLDASPFGLSHPPHLLSTAPVRIFPGYATVVLANLVWLNVWVVDTVLWTVLYPMYVRMGIGSTVFTFTSINCHAVNLPLMAVEMAANRIPVVPYHVAYTILFALAFTCMELVLHDAFRVAFSYPFQRLTPAAPMWYAAIAGGVFVFQSVVVLLDRAKRRAVAPPAGDGAADGDVPWYGAVPRPVGDAEAPGEEHAALLRAG